ncbi:MAG: SLBB domain-containing protein, partial [Actinomycetota bacterium]|nr:SLBB domain-containing protein [Actinomycetota bacterium]MDP9328418.1 SLBB domain-containing protein [Actinomycetota bacterium]
MTVPELLPPPPSRVIVSRIDRLTSALAAPGTWTTLDEHRTRFESTPPVRRRPDEALIAAVERAGLQGRGGAEFPTAIKLRAVAGGRRRPIVLANGSEGEPASAKDALLMARAPHLVLDGALLAAAAVGADQVIVGVKLGAGHARQAIERALDERYETEPWTARVRLVDVPPLYLAGEERALVNLINRGRAIPPQGSSRPFERGVGGRPTLVSNVETLAHLAFIHQMGPDRFREVGHADAPGTILVSLSGAVAKPGVYEVATGWPLPELIRAAGGATGEIGAVLVGGYAGTWLTGEQAGRATLDREGMAAVGGILGCGAIVALPSSSCGIHETAAVMRWLADQTAGQCGPCVHGLAAIATATDGLRLGTVSADVLVRLARWAGDVEGRGACRYP